MNKLGHYLSFIIKLGNTFLLLYIFVVLSLIILVNLTRIIYTFGKLYTISKCPKFVWHTTIGLEWHTETAANLQLITLLTDVIRSHLVMNG